MPPNPPTLLSTSIAASVPPLMPAYGFTDIARRLVRFANGERARYRAYAMMNNHGGVFSPKGRLGLAMGTVKNANDTEEFHRAINLAEQNTYRLSAFRREVLNGLRYLDNSQSPIGNRLRSGHWRVAP